MKKVRRSLATVLLLFALTTVAFADGQMDTPPAPAPGQMDTPPAPTSPGQMDTPPALNSDQTATGDALSELAYDILMFLPSLF